MVFHWEKMKCIIFSHWKSALGIIYFCTVDGFFRKLEKTSSELICTRLYFRFLLTTAAKQLCKYLSTYNLHYKTRLCVSCVMTCCPKVKNEPRLLHYVNCLFSLEHKYAINGEHFLSVQTFWLNQLYQENMSKILLANFVT